MKKKVIVILSVLAVCLIVFMKLKSSNQIVGYWSETDNDKDMVIVIDSKTYSGRATSADVEKFADKKIGVVKTKGKPTGLKDDIYSVKNQDSSKFIIVEYNAVMEKIVNLYVAEGVKDIPEEFQK